MTDDLGEDAMIFRLSEKLNGRIKAGTLATLPLDEDPFADWSAGLFVVGRSPYILLVNTKSLYSTVLPGKGVTDASAFVKRALNGLQEFMEADGLVGVYDRHVAPASASVRFTRALNRSVTGSMNDMTKHAAYWLTAGDGSPLEVASRLNTIPLSALKHNRSPYGLPRDVFRALLEAAERDRPTPDA
jgi:hypothetical protein